jgi:leucyl/phenylalanyl-tRNA--protein transferase
LAFILPVNADFFPHPLLSDQDGLLAIGASISAQSILLAYQFGIFPWNHQDDPLLWWYSHPRFVLFPQKLKISKSMKQIIKSDQFCLTIDTHFEEVMLSCRNIKRKNQDNTWITQELINVFLDLHHKGYAHSIEVWENDELVGGLYGLALGKVFYGESMFSKKSNASKFAFIKLVQWLKKHEFKVIDCQQETEHLKQFGAELISKLQFYELLKQNVFEQTLFGPWSETELKK